MGMSMGGAYGQTSQSSQSSSNQQNTYAPGQTAVQSQLGQDLASSLLSSQSGKLSPQVQAMKTASADAINKTAAGTVDRTNEALASRGFGKSGTAGKATLQAELGRQADLAGNESNYAGIQTGLNSQNLMAALNYAFTALGQTASGQSTGSTSGFSVGGGVGR